MDNPNPFLDENSMSHEEYRQSLQEHVRIVLERDWNFKILKALGKGSFGDVFSGTNPNYPGKVAIKITRSDQTWEKEKCDWANLNHPNVMPLLQGISMKQADIFVMPQLSEDLYQILGEIRNDPCGIDRVKSWLKDVLVAVDYLHQRQLCHLDIKSDNVMIDFNDRAVLCDFTFLNDTTAPTIRYGVPLIFCPPEACESLGYRLLVDGAKLDIWCSGMLAFNALSGHVMLRKLRQMRSWREDIYPFLLYELKAPQFHALMTEAFPVSSISYEEVAKALDFLQTVLRDRAEDRPCATELLKHAFLANERQTYSGDVEIAKDNSSAPVEEAVPFSVLLKNEQHCNRASEDRENGATLICAEHGAEAGDNLGFVRVNEKVFYMESFADFSVFMRDGQYCGHVRESIDDEAAPVRNNRIESGGTEITGNNESPGNVLSTVLVNTKNTQKDDNSSENNFYSSIEVPPSGLSLLPVESEPQYESLTPAIKWRISSWKAEFDKVFCPSFVLPQDVPVPEKLIHKSNSPEKVGKDSTQCCPKDAVIKKKKSRRKRVSGWFRRVWTGLWICGTNTADD